MTLYEEKELFFNTWKYDNFTSSSASEFYRDLFPVGTFEDRVGHQEEYEKTNKGNGFIVYTTEKDTKKTRIVFDDLAELFELQNNPCAFMSPIAYFGRNRTAANARMLYALTFDLDEVGEEELKNFFGYWVYQRRIPCPTYVVNSGGGVHLYYFLKTPMPMTPGNQKSIKKIKYALTERVWNGDTSRLKDRQYQGINQGFRLVGSKTKHGEIVTVWKTGERIAVEDFLNYIPKDVQAEFKIFESKMSLEEARKKYPEWYHQRIELGRKKMSWTCNRALYDWWKKQIDKIEFHHRYFFIMSLTIYAIKCGVEFDELEKDAFSFKDTMNQKSPENPFTDDDINSALEMYQECYKSFPRDEISKITAVEIKPNKRNGRTRAENLEIARFIRDMNDKTNGTIWRNEDGRPSLKDKVYKYLEQHPTDTKAEVVRGTGLSRPTVYKYYDECRAEILPQFKAEIEKEWAEEEQRLIDEAWHEYEEKLARLEADYDQSGELSTALEISFIKQSDEYLHTRFMYEQTHGIKLDENS